MTKTPLLLVLAACATSPHVVPTQTSVDTPITTLVWLGRGEAERIDDGVWQRAPEFDYEFSVEQRRFATHWESVKLLRRRHPAYDGSAGPREQTMFFRADFAPLNGAVSIAVSSSLGHGHGRADVEFRTAQMTMKAEVSSFAPFDTYRIDQTYRYEAGALDEEVSLLKGEQPWVRNREHATLFAPHQFAAAPTTLAH